MRLNNFAIMFCLIGAIINIVFRVVFNDSVYLIYASILSSLACFNYLLKIERLMQTSMKIDIITSINTKKIAKKVKEIKK